MDRVALDKGMLGLCDLVNDQVIIDITDTDWSQWRYVVKLWFSESGTSRTALGLGGRLKVPTGHTRVHHQEGVESDIFVKNAGVKGWLLSGLRDVSSMKSGGNISRCLTCSDIRKTPGSTCLC